MQLLEKRKRHKLSRNAVASLLVVIICAFCFMQKLAPFAPEQQNQTASAVASTNTLSMVEMNDDFGIMLMRASAYKTIVYVERLYFDYNPLSSLRLEELDCAIELKNEANEWARVGGWVKSEEGVRPGDALGRITTLYYLEIRQYWEWRTFTNNESWQVEVHDGYNICEFNFDRGRDGTIYFIDGVFALPERRYPQVAEKYDLVNANAELSKAVRDFSAYAAKKAVEFKDDAPYNLVPQEYRGPMLNVGTKADTSDGTKVNPAGFITALIVITVVCLVSMALVSSEDGNIVSDEDVPPGMTPDGTPAEVPQEIQEEYDQNRPVLTETERAELDKHKEFSLDNDAPSGQKLVKLKVKDEDGNQMSVYDENGSECYVNRKTYTVGNSTFSIIDRKAWLLIRYNAADMTLSTTNGERITVNADNKIMNMDGVECLSPVSMDDVLKKLSDMGQYTSSINYKKLMFRMDDDNALKIAMGESSRDISLGFFDTVKQALTNIFGGGSSTSKGFFSGLLDVLILIGVVLTCFVLVLLTAKFVGLLIKTKS